MDLRSRLVGSGGTLVLVAFRDGELGLALRLVVTAGSVLGSIGCWFFFDKLYLLSFFLLLVLCSTLLEVRWCGANGQEDSIDLRDIGHRDILLVVVWGPCCEGSCFGSVLCGRLCLDFRSVRSVLVNVFCRTLRKFSSVRSGARFPPSLFLFIINPGQF